VPNLITWTYQPNEGYGSLAQMYKGAQNQFNNYLGHALAYIGGTYETNKSVEQAGPIFEPVPVTLQLEALDFITRHSLQTPHWLLDSAILSRIGIPPTQVMNSTHEMVLNHL